MMDRFWLRSFAYLALASLAPWRETLLRPSWLLPGILSLSQRRKGRKGNDHGRKGYLVMDRFWLRSFAYLALASLAPWRETPCWPSWLLPGIS